MIRSVRHNDASKIVAIYNYYIVNSTATFETEPLSSEQMLCRIKGIEENSLPWLVAEDANGNILGYAYASKWKERSAYKHSVEITVYLDHNQSAKGIGTKLYKVLFSHLKSLSIHGVIAGIAQPNEASVVLHEKFGMKKVAYFPEVGNKFGKWVDVGYWQVGLNSKIAAKI